MFDTVEIGISEVDGTHAEFVRNVSESVYINKTLLPSNTRFWFYLDPWCTCKSQIVRYFLLPYEAGMKFGRVL